MSFNKRLQSKFQGQHDYNCAEKAPGTLGLVSKREEWDITQLLSMLPRKKASADFDRKMAAAFSLELEREVHHKNAQQILERVDH
jgi:hypothetical protein